MRLKGEGELIVKGQLVTPIEATTGIGGAADALDALVCEAQVRIDHRFTTIQAPLIVPLKSLSAHSWPHGFFF